MNTKSPRRFPNIALGSLSVFLLLAPFIIVFLIIQWLRSDVPGSLVAIVAITAVGLGAVCRIWVDARRGRNLRRSVADNTLVCGGIVVTICGIIVLFVSDFNDLVAVGALSFIGGMATLMGALRELHVQRMLSGTDA